MARIRSAWPAPRWSLGIASHRSEIGEVLMNGRTGEPRVERRWLVVVGAAVVGAFLLHGCHDSSGPEPEPTDPDYKIAYSRATGLFTVQQPHGPSLGPMPELVIVGT